MIELELKYELNTIPSSVGKLKIIKQKEQEDIYYDTPNYDLLKKGNFLRVRDGKRMEFKLFAGDTSHLFCQETVYNLDSFDSNQENINKILASLDLKPVENLNSFKQICDINNLQILCPIVKHRTSYTYDENCTISIDQVDNLGLFMEDEIMINSESLSTLQANQIKEQFVTNLQNSEILTGNEKKVNVGYVELYLLKHNIEAYNLGMYKI